MKVPVKISSFANKTLISIIFADFYRSLLSNLTGFCKKAIIFGIYCFGRRSS